MPYLCSPMESLATLEQNYAAHGEAANEAGVTLEGIVPLMRTVFVAEEPAILDEVRRMLAERADNARLAAEETLEDWTIIGTPDEVAEKIAIYQERLGMTHLVATRLRIGGLAPELMRDSVVLLAETVGAR